MNPKPRVVNEIIQKLSKGEKLAFSDIKELKKSLVLCGGEGNQLARLMVALLALVPENLSNPKWLSQLLKSNIKEGVFEPKVDPQKDILEDLEQMFPPPEPLRCYIETPGNPKKHLSLNKIKEMVFSPKPENQLEWLRIWLELESTKDPRVPSIKVDYELSEGETESEEESSMSYCSMEETDIRTASAGRSNFDFENIPIQGRKRFYSANESERVTKGFLEPEEKRHKVSAKNYLKKKLKNVFDAHIVADKFEKKMNEDEAKWKQNDKKDGNKGKDGSGVSCNTFSGTTKGHLPTKLSLFARYKETKSLASSQKSKKSSGDDLDIGHKLKKQSFFISSPTKSHKASKFVIKTPNKSRNRSFSRQKTRSKSLKPLKKFMLLKPKKVNIYFQSLFSCSSSSQKASPPQRKSLFMSPKKNRRKRKMSLPEKWKNQKLDKKRKKNKKSELLIFTKNRLKRFDQTFPTKFGNYLRVKATADRNHFARDIEKGASTTVSKGFYLTRKKKKDGFLKKLRG